MSTTERSRTSARRESLLGDQPGAFASARYVRITPMKARRVVNMVRGLQVDEALTLLQFAPQAASETVYKVPYLRRNLMRCKISVLLLLSGIVSGRRSYKVL